MIRPAQGELFQFKKNQSQCIRLKVDYKYQFKPAITLSGGLAYEYEMKGKADTVALKKHNLDEASLKGSTAILELGVETQMTPKLPLYFDAKIRGFVGKREGATGMLQVRYQF